MCHRAIPSRRWWDMGHRLTLGYPMTWVDKLLLMAWCAILVGILGLCLIVLSF